MGGLCCTYIEFTGALFIADVLEPVFLSCLNLLVGSKAGGVQYLSYNSLGIKKENDPIPIDFEIYAIYPNPNNGQCKIDLNIDKVGTYEITVFDIHGRTINRVFNGPLNKGKYTFALQDIISSGVYFIRLQKDDLFVIKKFVRLK